MHVNSFAVNQSITRTALVVVDAVADTCNFVINLMMAAMVNQLQQVRITKQSSSIEDMLREEARAL
jgi:hypothetical protein